MAKNRKKMINFLIFLSIFIYLFLLIYCDVFIDSSFHLNKMCDVFSISLIFVQIIFSKLFDFEFFALISFFLFFFNFYLFCLLFYFRNKIFRFYFDQNIKFDHKILKLVENCCKAPSFIVIFYGKGSNFVFEELKKNSVVFKNILNFNIENKNFLDIYHKNPYGRISGILFKYFYLDEINLIKKSSDFYENF